MPKPRKDLICLSSPLIMRLAAVLLLNAVLPKTVAALSEHVSLSRVNVVAKLVEPVTETLNAITRP